MGFVPLVVAQCTGVLEECDLPRTLPWYFGLAIAVAWFAAVLGVVLLIRRRLTNRLEARRERRRAVVARKSTDVDLW